MFESLLPTRWAMMAKRGKCQKIETDSCILYYHCRGDLRKGKEYIHIVIKDDWNLDIGAHEHVCHILSRLLSDGAVIYYHKSATETKEAFTIANFHVRNRYLKWITIEIGGDIDIARFISPLKSKVEEMERSLVI